MSRWFTWPLPAIFDRASGLAAEHLAEFPDDELIRRVRAACRC